MNQTITLKVILFFSGLILIVSGVEAFQNPQQLMPDEARRFGGNFGYFSETLTTSFLMLFGGMWIMSGALINKISKWSALTSAFIYLGFSISQVVAMVTTKVPSETVITDTFLQTVLGLTAMFAFVLFCKRNSEISEPSLPEMSV